LITVLIMQALFVAPAAGQPAGMAGAFARMGFGARGMGMGNALTAVGNGEIASYYNPALVPFAVDRTASVTAGILSLDRYLNFVSYTQAVKPTAGLSVGLINAGVREIDGRDNDGRHTEKYSTFENQFFLSFANRVDEKVSLGVTVKLYYSKLFDEVTTSSVGFDLGAFIPLTDALSFGAVVQDINSRYKWDTKALYGQSGKSSDDKFAVLRRIGMSYTLPSRLGTASVEFQNATGSTILRCGVEYNLHELFSIRSGIDRIEFSDATGVKPTFGFSARNPFNGWTPSLTYAYVVESFAPHGMHIISISGTF
jgi:hypothetical protein